jgi:hypothetical protein
MNWKRAEFPSLHRRKEGGRAIHAAKHRLTAAKRKRVSAQPQGMPERFSD